MVGTRTFFIACLAVAVILAGVITGGALQSRDMSESASAGYAVWQANGCEGCHTLFGQGGAYAPDLTHIYNQRGEDYIREFMVNPNAFHPDARVMPRFTITAGETSQLIDFLQWVNNTDVAENWPPNPIQVAGMGGLTVVTSPNSPDASSGDEDPAVARGRTLYTQKCASCHSIERDIIIIGPTFYGIADTAWYRIPGLSPEGYIRESILNPGDFIVEGFPDAMQKNFGDVLSSQDIDDLIAFLMTFEDPERG